MRAFVLALAAAAVCAVRGASAESASSDMVIVELNRAIDVSGQVRALAAAPAARVCSPSCNI